MTGISLTNTIHVMPLFYLKYMKHIIILIAGIYSLVGKVQGQSITLEGMVGQRNFWTQHVLSKQMSHTKFGYFHVSSLHAFYNETREELMSQSYLTFQMNKSIKLGVGTFYTTANGFVPSFQAQFFHKGKNHFVLAIPRVDLVGKPSYDVMIMAEYFPKLNDKIGFYGRFQTMLNYTGETHNRSYQNFRAGFNFESFQAGIALNMDAYGRYKKYYSNYGIFIRKVLL